jgi:hypothetical protein
MRLLRKSARARLSDMRKPNLTCEDYLRLSLGAGVQASRQGGQVPAAARIVKLRVRPEF